MLQLPIQDQPRARVWKFDVDPLVLITALLYLAINE